MKKILSINMKIVLVIFPLLSLKSGVLKMPESQRIRKENDTLRQEIRQLSNKIKVVDDQIQYKDSLDSTRAVDTTK